MLRRWLILCFAISSLAAPAAFCTEPNTTPNHVVSHIPRQRVESSAIAAVGYSKRQHILEIEFVNGAIYRYCDVPPVVHRDLMSAVSKTRFYDSNIRRHYRSVLVQPRHAGQSVN